MADELAKERGQVDTTEGLVGLLELMPQLEVFLSGVGVLGKRKDGSLDFVANGPGSLNWLEVRFNDGLIFDMRLKPTHVSAGDTISISGNAPSMIADAIYKAIDNGALLNEPAAT